MLTFPGPDPGTAPGNPRLLSVVRSCGGGEAAGWPGKPHSYGWGPLLRYADEDSATVWLEADRPREARVVCEDGTEGTAPTWRIAGHHYALVTLTGLRPGTGTAYRVLLDGEQLWPQPDSPYPPSVIRTTPAGPAPVTVTFGSCRWAAPPYEAGDGEGAVKDPMDPDALGALARAVADGSATRPDLLLLLGDHLRASRRVSSAMDHFSETPQPPSDRPTVRPSDRPTVRPACHLHRVDVGGP